EQDRERDVERPHTRPPSLRMARLIDLRAGDVSAAEFLIASRARPAAQEAQMRFAAAALIATLSLSARAKETVRIAFVGPLTGGNSAIGLGGRNSADLAVKLRNADAKAKYQYELLVLDDE